MQEMFPAPQPVPLQSRQAVSQPPRGEKQDSASKFSRSAYADVRWCWITLNYADQINNKLRAMRLAAPPKAHIGNVAQGQIVAAPLTFRF
jgi:hypothetical protein